MHQLFYCIKGYKHLKNDLNCTEIVSWSGFDKAIFIDKLTSGFVFEIDIKLNYSVKFY